MGQRDVGDRRRLLKSRGAWGLEHWPVSSARAAGASRGRDTGRRSSETKGIYAGWLVRRRRDVAGCDHAVGDFLAQKGPLETFGFGPLDSLVLSGGNGHSPGRSLACKIPPSPYRSECPAGRRASLLRNEPVAVDCACMCGRFGFSDVEKMPERFSAARPLLIEPRYNAAPGQDLPVVLREDSENALALMRWGLVPSWARDEKIGYKMINARVETVGERPSYREPLQSRRCLVPAQLVLRVEAGAGRPEDPVCDPPEGRGAFCDGRAL